VWLWNTNHSPRSQHPYAMLIDLQKFDVDNCHHVGESCQNNQRPAKGPSGQVAAKGVREDDDDAGGGDEGHQDDCVAVQAVKEYGLVPDSRDELQRDQERRWEDGVEMHLDADLVEAHVVIVAFSRSCAGRSGIVWVAENAAEGHVLQAGEREAN